MIPNKNGNIYEPKKLVSVKPSSAVTYTDHCHSGLEQFEGIETWYSPGRQYIDEFIKDKLGGLSEDVIIETLKEKFPENFV